jgi:hypothetical protein
MAEGAFNIGNIAERCSFPTAVTDCARRRRRLSEKVERLPSLMTNGFLFRKVCENIPEGWLIDDPT